VNWRPVAGIVLRQIYLMRGSPARLLRGASAIYGRQYNPVLTLQALCYFEDLTGPLSEKIKTDLIGAVKSVSLRNLPVIAASQKIGESTGRTVP
jgi:hypothetical protein